MWNNKLKAVTFSYDDGVTQDIKLIELFNQYGLKCTFNLNSELLGKNNMLMQEGKRIAQYKVHAEDVKSIYEGHEVAAHTLTHPRLPGLADEEEIVRQVEQDRLNLSALVGYDVVGMAYPCGGVNNDDRVEEIIRKRTGILYSRTITTTGSFDPQENLLRFNPSIYHLEFDKLMQMGEEFLALEPTVPQLFYVWGHAYELDCGSDYWNRMEEFCRLISGRSDIFYGTNKEVLL